MSQKARTANVRPTQVERAEILRQLKRKAVSGDVVAAGVLLNWLQAESTRTEK